ncbi:acyl-CoA dehydrogenase family protein [Actinacidiphila sp. ITFR-21]|uniref:acyl-CoA dehydrogenase family protein n=1 Tax=Actinacidiphila sp. ITFR-21 TaxID=3075199 RepID=UPI00288B81B5|nr:acyl-CoA dehydrogenase family protein [Streptomyces sp. ITFR-21]WNI18999.1 acyl-CoA dehydrogenase family protein [Streptomyces sp. ITFR-21]
MNAVQESPGAERLAYFTPPDTLQRRAALASMLTRELDFDNVRPQLLGDQPYDTRLWKTLIGEVGLGGVLAPESAGGLQLRFEDFATTTAELGRRLYPGPHFGSVTLALGALTPLLETAAGERPAAGTVPELAASVVSGDVIAALAFMDDAGSWPPDGAGVTAARGPDGGWTLTGTRGLVVNASQAGTLVVLADADGEPALLAVNTSAARLTDLDSIDPTRPLARVALDAAPGVLLASGPQAVRAVEHAVTVARVAIAAEAVGGAEAALHEAVDYSLQRRQFNRPIGGFQSIKHLCADGLIATQAAIAALSYATWALDDGSAEAPAALLAAKIAATDTYLKVAADCIHIHGTYGYTRDLVSQCHYRRAKWLSLFLGTNSEDRRRLAALLEV